MKQTALYQLAGLGGTFDHFHAGHEQFLRFAALQAQQLLIGISRGELLQNKTCAQSIESFATRMHAVAQFCQHEGIDAHFVPLDDVYGPTIEPSSTIDCLVATAATQVGAAQINAERTQRELSPLPVLIAPFHLDTHKQPLSASKIRCGESDRRGFRYIDLFANTRQLSATQRIALQAPQGPVVASPSTPMPSKEGQKNARVVIGDVVLHTFIRERWPFDLGIYDTVTQRQPTTHAFAFPEMQLRRVVNPAGHITTQMVQVLESWKKAPFTYLQVSGEEDLATLAVALLFPLGTYVYYGQPGVGMVEFQITEEHKSHLAKLLQQP